MVGEGVESGLSVISTHAAGPDSSETHPACRKVNDGVVDAAAAESAAGGYGPDDLPVARKEIERERVRERVDLGDRLLHLPESENRQDGAE